MSPPPASLQTLQKLPVVGKTVLAVETSCDETACALYCPRRGLLGERVFSQWRKHAAYGGIVPELASRDHLRRLLPLIDDLLRAVGERPALLAYTRGPGLAGALLAGAATTQALAAACGLPVVAVNHLEGHLLSPLLLARPPSFPYIALLVSGGHTQLYLARAVGRYQLLGQTPDDAAGEAFDKVAALLGLGYPGGARLERLAARASAAAAAGIRLPSPALRAYDFSFSGLKTATRRAAAANPAAAVAAAFQGVVAAGLARQAGAAMRNFAVPRLAAVGGVAQNKAVARALAAAARAAGGGLWRPRRRHCGDNAAMIALVAALKGGGKAAGAFDVAPRWQPATAKQSRPRRRA